MPLFDEQTGFNTEEMISERHTYLEECGWERIEVNRAQYALGGWFDNLDEIGSIYKRTDGSEKLLRVSPVAPINTLFSTKHLLLVETKFRRGLLQCAQGSIIPIFKVE